MGYIGDGGPATAAGLNNINGVALDSSGNIFIADSGNNRVRRVDAVTGIITTVAGVGTAGFSGDGGPATSAQLNTPLSVALDNSGHLFIGDFNNRIRQVILGVGSGLSTSTLTFSTHVALGSTSAAQTITLTSTGGVPLLISSIKASTNFTATNTCPIAPATLNPGSTCTISVKFAPMVAGLATGNITISDNAVDTPQMVSLTGTGVGPVAELSPAGLTFAAQTIGAASTAQTVTLSNSGDTALTITSIAISGDYSQTNHCGPSLAPATSCTVTVTFTPTMGGTRTGTLTITDNATGSPHSITLTGTGADFTGAPAAGAPASATVTAGQPATYTVSFAGSAGFNGTVNLTCTGAPLHATCAVNPTSLQLTGTTPANVTVNVTTTARSLVVPQNFTSPPGAMKIPQPLLWCLALMMCGLLLAWMAGKRRRVPLRLSLATAVFSVLTLAVLSLAACGGGGSSSPPPGNPGTPAGTYILTVTGTLTSGAITQTHDVKLTLTVQ